MFGATHETKRAAICLVAVLSAGLVFVAPASAKPEARERAAARADRDTQRREREDERNDAARRSRGDDAEVEKPHDAKASRRGEPHARKDARDEKPSGGGKAKDKKGAAPANPKAGRATKQLPAARPTRGPGELQTPARQGSDRFRPSSAGGTSLEQRRVLPPQARRDSAPARLERPIDPPRPTRSGQASSELERASKEGDVRRRPSDDGDMQSAEKPARSTSSKPSRTSRARRMK